MWGNFKLKGRTNLAKLIQLVEKRSEHIVDKYVYVHFYEEWINSF